MPSRRRLICVKTIFNFWNLLRLVLRLDSLKSKSEIKVHKFRIEACMYFDFWCLSWLFLEPTLNTSIYIWWWLMHEIRGISYGHIYRQAEADGRQQNKITLTSSQHPAIMYTTDTIQIQDKTRDPNKTHIFHFQTMARILEKLKTSNKAINKQKWFRNFLT